MQILITCAPEEGTYIITVSFLNEKKQPVIPKKITWSLVDRYNNVINNRKEEEIVNLGSFISIVLSGDDLKFQVGEWGETTRVFIIKVIYDSMYGENLPLRKSASFTIERAGPTPSQ